MSRSVSFKPVSNSHGPLPARFVVSEGCSSGEGPEWHVWFNVEIDNHERCDHCGEMFEVEHQRRAPPFTTWKEQRCIVPRVVVAFNEGGYAFTQVCLDCILETALELSS